MKRFLIFTLVFPLIALAVFTAPDGFKNFVNWLGYAYLAAIILAWLSAAADWALSAKPTFHRIAGTAIVGGFITSATARFLWGGFYEFWPAVMAGLVGAIPAAACSWLSAAGDKTPVAPDARKT